MKPSLNRDKRFNDLNVNKIFIKILWIDFVGDKTTMREKRLKNIMTMEL